MDKQQFVTLIDAHSRLLYHIAWTMLGSPEDVKDALQDTALHAWEKRITLRDESSFRPWITRIMVNVCSGMLRKRKRVVPLANAPEPAAPPPDPTLTLALQALPEKYRLPMLLCYAYGMSEKEIAEALRIPASTVRGRIYRAKQQLRKELAE